MADCLTSILDSGFISDCENEISSGTLGGVWAFNLSDIASYTKTSAHGVTDIVLNAGAVGFKFEMGAGGTSFRVNPTQEQTRLDQTARAFTHSVAVSFSNIKTATKDIVANFAQNNIVLVVENRQKTMEEGKFEIYGTEVGLTLMEESRDGNDQASGGFLNATLATNSDNSYETNLPANLFDTDVVTTRALLDSKLTPTP